MPTTHRTRIPNGHMRVAMQHWLGLMIPALVQAPAECKCHGLQGLGPGGGPGLSDFRGRHDTCCYNSSRAKTERHDSVLRALKAALAVIGVTSKFSTVLSHSRRHLPDGSMDPTDRSRKQPDLAVYDAHSGGIFPTLVDAVVTDPTASTQPNSSETRVGAAAAARERTKRRKYHAMAASRHFIFRAFGIETASQPAS